jgi:hypothetical protein
MPRQSGQKHTYAYRIDCQGGWTCEGKAVVDQELFSLLSRSLVRDEQGCFWVRCQGEVHPVEVADAPLTAVGLKLRTGPRGRLKKVRLVLADGREPELKGNLTVSVDNVLYLEPDKPGLKIRLARQPFYELMRYLEEDGKGYYLQVDQVRYYIDSAIKGEKRL